MRAEREPRAGIAIEATSLPTTVLTRIGPFVGHLSNHAQGVRDVIMIIR
jgi:hypothetical protein